MSIGYTPTTEGLGGDGFQRFPKGMWWDLKSRLVISVGLTRIDKD